MKNNLKQEIYNTALDAKKRVENNIASLSDTVSLNEYRHLTRQSDCGLIWTDALQSALNEHEIIIIPSSDEVYWIDGTVVIPSNRHIEACGATIRLVPEYPYIMLRNEHTHDGTHAPIDTSDRDYNISICGGSWEEGGGSPFGRKYSSDFEIFKGVQTFMLFNNLSELSLTDITYVRTSNFAVQIGDITDGVFENLLYVSCCGDGLHVNGNCENLYIRNICGQTGDDLLALNMYDWPCSSVNYGPGKNIFCEDIHPDDNGVKAMRLLPGIYKYDNGSSVDCSLNNIYIRKASGISEFKLYLQTMPYTIGENHELGEAGSGDNIFFEDITVVSNRPGYLSRSGDYGTFFINSNIGYISFENIDFKVSDNTDSKDYLIAVGPLTLQSGNTETFDPYISSITDTLEMKNIRVNAIDAKSIDEILSVIELNDVNCDGLSSGCGKINRIILDGKDVK